MQMPDESKLHTQLPKSALLSSVELPGRYVILELVGQGGMGLVFRAEDKHLGRDVAIKVLNFEGSKDADLQERFSREAKVLASLDHPNIVKLLAWGLSENGNPYQVIEFLEGGTVSLEIGNGKRLKPARFFEIFSPVLDGLQHAHSRGVVHRDLKPSNIMFSLADDKVRPKIVDFGIARVQLSDSAMGNTLTQTGHLLGSPIYMSPEQCKGEKASQLSDIYSLACVMYEALTGQPPHKGETAMELMYKHMTEIPLSLESIASGAASKRLGRLIDRCLAKDPSMRPQSAADVLAELKTIFESQLDTSSIFAPEAKIERDKRTALSKYLFLIFLLFVAAAGLIKSALMRAPDSKGSRVPEKHARDMLIEVQRLEWTGKNKESLALAKETLVRALEQKDRDSELHAEFEIGQNLASLGEHQAAILALKKAVALSHKCNPTHYMRTHTKIVLAQELMATGDLENAADLLEQSLHDFIDKAIDLDRKYLYKARIMLAAIRVKQGHPDAAREVINSQWYYCRSIAEQLGINDTEDMFELLRAESVMGLARSAATRFDSLAFCLSKALITKVERAGLYTKAALLAQSMKLPSEYLRFTKLAALESAKRDLPLPQGNRAVEKHKPGGELKDLLPKNF